MMSEGIRREEGLLCLGQGKEEEGVCGLWFHKKGVIKDSVKKRGRVVAILKGEVCGGKQCQGIEE